MATGLHHIYLETHNWGKAVAYWKQLGYELTFETDHHSGQLRPPQSGPYLFLAEVPEDRTPQTNLYIGVEPGDRFEPTAPVSIVEAFTATHWGTQVMTTHDPDGRTVYLEQPVES